MSVLETVPVTDDVGVSYLTRPCLSDRPRPGPGPGPGLRPGRRLGQGSGLGL